MPAIRKDATDLYEEAAAAFGGALERLARAYEADPDRPTAECNQAGR